MLLSLTQTLIKYFSPYLVAVVLYNKGYCITDVKLVTIQQRLCLSVLKQFSWMENMYHEISVSKCICIMHSCKWWTAMKQTRRRSYCSKLYNICKDGLFTSETVLPLAVM